VKTTYGLRRVKGLCVAIGKYRGEVHHLAPMNPGRLLWLSSGGKKAVDTLNGTMVTPIRLIWTQGRDWYTSINGVVVTWVVANRLLEVDPPGVRFPLNAMIFWSYPSFEASSRQF
jgi:hypothetical protein